MFLVLESRKQNLMKISNINSPLEIFYGELTSYFTILYIFTDFVFGETLKIILFTVQNKVTRILFAIHWHPHDGLVSSLYTSSQLLASFSKFWSLSPLKRRLPLLFFIILNISIERLDDILHANIFSLIQMKAQLKCATIFSHPGKLQADNQKQKH